MGDRKHRPLTTTQLSHLADLCTQLATELRAEHAPGIQQLLATEATTGYPRSSSGAGNTPGSGDNTPTEAAALHTDRTAINAYDHIRAQHQLHQLAGTVLDGLQARNPTRTVKACNRCGHPLEPGRTRCQKVDDNGTPCQASEDAWPDCRDCSEPMPPGKRHGGRCPACHQFFRRNGFTKASAAKYRDSFAQRWADEGVTP